MANTQERFSQEPIELDADRRLNDEELDLVAGGGFWDVLKEVGKVALPVAGSLLG
jgi:hypothetical protein